MSEITEDGVLTPLESHEQFLGVVMEFLKNPNSTILICIEDGQGFRVLSNTNSASWQRGAGMSIADRAAVRMMQAVPQEAMEELRDEVEKVDRQVTAMKKGRTN